MKVSEIVIIQQNYQAGKYDIKQHSDDRTRPVKSLLGRLKNIGLASEKLYRRTLRSQNLVV